MSERIGRVARLLTAIAFATLMLGGCGSNPEIGSYPAANKSDCLPDITLVDQNGNPVNLASLKGEPVLIDFVYTTCSQECPLLTEKMRSVATSLGPELGAKARIVSVSLDPEHDHPLQLRDYTRTQDANRPGWIFLTGSPADVDRALAAFKLKRMHMADGSVNHMSSAFLLGPDGHQIRQYNGMEVSADTVVSDIHRAVADATAVASSERRN